MRLRSVDQLLTILFFTNSTNCAIGKRFLNVALSFMCLFDPSMPLLLEDTVRNG